MNNLPLEQLKNIQMYSGENNLDQVPTIFFDQHLFQPNNNLDPRQVTNLKITDTVQMNYIGQFTNLIELDCSNINFLGKLKGFPCGIQRLNCRENMITHLEKIDSLIYLDCCYNNIEKLPKLRNLKFLRVDKGTDISNVSENIGIEIQIIDEDEINEIFGDSIAFGTGRYYRLS